MDHLRRKKGFTLIELLVALTIMIVISLVAFLNLRSRKNLGDLNNTTSQIVTILHEAQSRARSGQTGNAWGVHFDNGTGTTAFYILFQGVYSTTSTVGNRYPLPADIKYATSTIASGASTTVTFPVDSGIPSVSSTITLQLNNGTSSTIHVNGLSGLIALGSPSSIAFVQTTGALHGAGITTCNVQFPSSTTAGDLIVVVLGDKPSSTAVASIVDDSGDTFVAAASASNTVIAGGIWYAANIAGGAKSVTTTLNMVPTGNNCIASEFSGVHSLDIALASSGLSYGFTSGTSTTNFANELIVGGGGTPNNPNQPFLIDSYPGFTKVSSSSADFIFQDYEIVGPVGQYSTGASTTFNPNWFMGMATFH